MSLPGPRFTYEDYKLLPEDKRHEIVAGELLVTPAPSIHHSLPPCRPRAVCRRGDGEVIRGALTTLDVRWSTKHPAAGD